MRRAGDVRPSGAGSPGAGRADLLLAIGACSGAWALLPSDGHFHPVALALITVAWVSAVAAIALGSRAARSAEDGATCRVLTAGALLSCCVQVFVPPGAYLAPAHPVAFRVAALASASVAATYFARVPRWLARWRFAALVVAFAVMAAVVLRASPAPRIDVWSLQQRAAQGFLQGENPYAMAYPDPYGGGPFNAPALLDPAGRIDVFPYPPLTFVLEAPFFLAFRDVRWFLALAVVLAAWCVRRLSTSVVSEVAAVLLLFQPRSFFVIEQGWTEPLVLAATGLSLLSLRTAARAGGRWILAGMAGALLLASKQYAPLIAVPLAHVLPPRSRWKAVALAVGVAALTFLPYAVWNARELWRDVVLAQVLQPFRFDALSWLVPLARVLQRPVSPAAGAIVAATLVATTWRWSASLAHGMRVAAAAFIGFVLFNKQAFANYYWLGVGLLLLACVLAVPCSAARGGGPSVNAAAALAGPRRLGSCQ